jgi:hypothetical protein
MGYIISFKNGHVSPGGSRRSSSRIIIDGKKKPITDMYFTEKGLAERLKREERGSEYRVLPIPLFIGRNVGNIWQPGKSDNLIMVRDTKAKQLRIVTKPKYVNVDERLHMNGKLLRY